MKKYNYLLNVTFFAGSDDLMDTDRGVYLLMLDKKVSFEEMKNIFCKVNHLLSPYLDEDEYEKKDFPYSYEAGLNIYTLMEGVCYYTNGQIIEFDNLRGELHIDDCYSILQWQ